jgi:hypothetical protein
MAAGWGAAVAALALALAADADPSPPAADPAHASQTKPTSPTSPPALDGISYDYDYDGSDVHKPERRWQGRVFVHRKAAELAGQPLPVLVFLHGNNPEGIKYRWMGGGSEGDIRRIAADLMEAGQVPPFLVAAPSSIDPYTMSDAGASWPGFDLDNFLDKTEERLGSIAAIDRGRVIVAAHSGAGCNIRGGLNSALHAKTTPVLAGLSIDTCMLLDLAASLAHVRPTTHVIVSWQTISWPEREFGSFKVIFDREVKKAPPVAAGILRQLDPMQVNLPGVHNAIVGLTLERWLPRLLPSTPGVSSTAVATVGLDAGGG